MTASVSIGEFSRLTHLSVKTLRYYHDIGLLDPASVDDSTGYRRYTTDQAATAHRIRRLRELDMPVPRIREVLAAEDPDRRNSALRAHLLHMEAELARTQDVVASLRSLLGPAVPIPVEYRSIAATPTLAVRGHVRRDAIDVWCGETFPLLYQTAAMAGIPVLGVGGATYSTEFFENDEGAVMAYVPVSADATAPTGTEAVELPARDFAIAVHHGPFIDFDRTYGALGAHVAEHDASLDEPIRELYLVGPDTTDDASTFRTEVCWPLRRNA